jgi:prepilin-type N-terminal cleavage/methylation domain-containing protein
MRTSISSNHFKSHSVTKHATDRGFSLLEMVVAMGLLTVGLLAVAAAIGYALMASNGSRNVTNSKLLIVSVLEQMETLRDTGGLSFGQIANVGQVDNTGSPSNFAGFDTGFVPVSSTPGPDGIFGTADDLIDPGSDGIYGTVDDVAKPSLARPGVTRQILITQLGPQLKRIQVTLRYAPRGGDQKELVGVSYLNDDSHGNYIP